jgi:hypothetical protein
MSDDWRAAQGLDEYAAYKRRRAGDIARQAKHDLHEDINRGGLDAELLRTNRGPSPLRLTGAEMSQLVAEEKQGLVEMTRDDTGAITHIQRIDTTRKATEK